MKRLLQLAVVALLGNAAYRVGNEYMTYYMVRDAVREAVLYGPNDEAALRAKIMDVVAGHDVPLTPERLSLKRTEQVVHVEAAYDRIVEVAPRYPYPLHFRWAYDVDRAKAGRTMP